MLARVERTAWVSYLRVSTPDQADRELSLPAQRRAVEDFATRHGARIEREYVEAGALGASPHRPVFRRMLEDVLRPGSDVSTIVVHHTSRFSRNSTEVWRGGRRSARMGALLKACVIEPVDDQLARLAGEALASIGGGGVMDAIVMASAARRENRVLTADPNDLIRLRACFPSVRVISL